MYLEVMRQVPKSIVFTPSKIVAQRLEQLGRISQLSTDQILDDVLGDYLDQIFSGCPDTDLLASHIDGYAHPSQKKARTIADAYNAFSLASARKYNVNPAYQATVVKDSRGISRVRVQLGKPLKETTCGAVSA